MSNSTETKTTRNEPSKRNKRMKHRRQQTVTNNKRSKAVGAEKGRAIHAREWRPKSDAQGAQTPN
jgi:hypothetical protein